MRVERGRRAWVRMTAIQGQPEPELARIEPAGNAAVLGRATAAPGLVLGGRDARPTVPCDGFPAFGSARSGGFERARGAAASGSRLAAGTGRPARALTRRAAAGSSFASPLARPEGRAGAKDAPRITRERDRLAEEIADYQETGQVGRLPSVRLNRSRPRNQTSFSRKPGKLAFRPLGFGRTNTRAPESTSGFAPAPRLAPLP